MVNFGMIMALLGVAMAGVLGPIGSAIGMAKAGDAAAGVLPEQPELYGRALVIQAIPGTQAIYGFLVAVLYLTSLGIVGGDLATLTAFDGFMYLVAAIPVAVVGLVAGVYQGKVAASAITMAGKDPNLATRGMILAAMVETTQLLSLLITVLIWLSF